MNDPIVIVGAARTPMGAFQGDFSSKSASDLGAVAIKAAVERAGVDASLVEHVYFGNCLMAGQGQAPARQALIKAGLPLSTGAVTLSKMCGSAMQAAIFAHDQLVAGSADVVVAGGMESMTNAPYLIPKARGGYRIGHAPMFDHMMLDGLEDAYSRNEKTGEGRSMGTFAEECVAKYCFTARRAGQLRDRLGQARPGRRRIRRLRLGNRAGHRRHRLGEPSSRRTKARSRPRSTRSRPCARRSRRMAPSPPLPRRRSTTAPPRWS
jgi:acetyl-CoA acetyltransferase